MSRSIEDVWATYDAMEARLSAALSERMLDLAALSPGLAVLDLAAGRGEPGLRAAHRVGPAGRVVLVDPAASMLEMARARAEAEGLTQVELCARSAEHLEVLADASFDAATARWGLMYMASPRAALAEARRLLRPGAPLVVAVWAEPERVSYHTWPRRWLAPEHRGPPPDPASPGPFRYADPDVLRGELEAAGFAVEHTEERWVDVVEVDTIDALLEWARCFGLSRLLAPLDRATQRAWEERFRAEAPALARDGRLYLGGVTRVVVGRAR